MKRLSNFWALALFGLLLAGILAACGDATSTSAPAAGSAAMTTDAAMAKPTDAMSKGGDAMAKPTDGAMMTQTTAAAMSKSGDAMSKTTPDAMAKPTDGAMMAQTTEAAMSKSGDAMAKPTGDAMSKSGDAMSKAGPLAGNFNNQGAEAVAGKATLGKTTDGKLILRFENFKSANGPDLHVYLSKDASPSTTTQVKNGIEVGKLKATDGSLNYELDSSLDISQYKSVVIYCQSVSAIFGYANLQAGAA